MNPLRIAFDMDGTLADLSSAYSDVEARLFGPVAVEHVRPVPEEREAEQHGVRTPATISDKREEGPKPTTAGRRRHRDDVWRAIEATPNFWTTLKPLENGAVKRVFDLTLEHNWEVFFVTQRPATAGATVQSQTYKWLMEQGFRTPSVIPLSGGRGRCAAALQLDYLIDDTPQNCVDVLSDSSTRAILLIDGNDTLAANSARRLGIGTVQSIHEALDLLVQATAARANPSLYEKLRKMVGWK